MPQGTKMGYPHAISLLLLFNHLFYCVTLGAFSMRVHFSLFHPIKYNSAYFKILLRQYFPYLGRNTEIQEKKLSSTLEVREKARPFLSCPGSKLRTFTIFHLNILHFNTD